VLRGISDSRPAHAASEPHKTVVLIRLIMPHSGLGGTQGVEVLSSLGRGCSLFARLAAAFARKEPIGRPGYFVTL